MTVLEVTAPTSIPLRFVAGVLAGVAATLAMDLVMSGLPEGATPAAVASGVSTRRPPHSAPDRLASVVHYLAGILTGGLFVWVLFAVEALIDGPSLASTLVATVVLYVLMVGFFAAVVLPRSPVIPDEPAIDQRRGTLGVSRCNAFVETHRGEIGFSGCESSLQFFAGGTCGHTVSVVFHTRRP